MKLMYYDVDKDDYIQTILDVLQQIFIREHRYNLSYFGQEVIKDEN